MGLRADRIIVLLSAGLIMMAAIQGVMILSKVLDHVVAEADDDGVVAVD